MLLLPTWVADFRDANLRSAGPVWPAQVARAAAHCRDSHAATATVRIDPPGWKAVLVCRASPGACRCLGRGGVRVPGGVRARRATSGGALVAFVAINGAPVEDR